MCQTRPGAGPMWRRQVDPAGRNQIAVAAGANALACAARVEDAAPGPGTVLLLQTEARPAETARLIARARTRGTSAVLNLAPPDVLPDGALRAVDLLVVNEHEIAWLAARFGCAADAAALRMALGAGTDVAVTRGDARAEAATAAGTVRVAALRLGLSLRTPPPGHALVGCLRRW